MSGRVIATPSGVTSRASSRESPPKIPFGSSVIGLLARSTVVRVPRPANSSPGSVVIEPPLALNVVSELRPASRSAGTALSPDPRLSVVSPDMPAKSPESSAAGACVARSISLSAASWFGVTSVQSVAVALSISITTAGLRSQTPVSAVVIALATFEAVPAPATFTALTR